MDSEGNWFECLKEQKKVTLKKDDEDEELEEYEANKKIKKEQIE